jgi:photosystem II Psb28-2 protein
MSISPGIEFYNGIPEELINVSLRRSKETGIRNVLMTFKPLKATENFQSFTKRSHGDLKLIDSEGVISVTPSAVKLILGGEEGDELKGVECSFAIPDDEHWDRFMRFMDRYAEANGMSYQASPKKQ